MTPFHNLKNIGNWQMYDLRPMAINLLAEIDWTRGQPAHIMEKETISWPSCDQIAVPLDKISSNLLLSTRSGIYGDIQKSLTTHSITVLALMKIWNRCCSVRKYFKAFIPNYCKRCIDFLTDDLQYAYITYKNKCHTKDGGITCGKIIAKTEKS